jgi:hydrophobic/amphiphilic exporter-1 (mainly G- bacteria), HAE1 family
MSPARLAIRRPVTTGMVFVSLALLGLISLKLLPLEFFPDIDFPGMMVQVPYQGSSPEEVERLITRPIEDVLSTMAGIQRMHSNSSQNNAGIFVFFGWDVDMAAKGVEARDKIDGIRHLLPEDLERVFVRKFTNVDEPILGLRIGSGRDLSESYELLDRNVRRRLERIDGVAQVSLDGVEPREVRILLHADRVAAHQVDLNDLSQRLQQANFSSSAGYITDVAAGLRVRVSPQGEFRSLEEIRALPINDRGLRLGDVADVVLESPPMRYGRLLDGNFAVSIDIFPEAGANVVEVSRAVLAEIDAINELPEMAGISLYVLFSQAEGIVSSLRDLAMAGLLGALMSMIVLYVFLRQWATTLIVMLSVPSAILITLGAMYFLGLTLNILTMMGLMLAIGMLVDNAVVVTESIYRKKQQFPDQPGRATLLGVREVALAISAGTLTTIIVFLPNIFGGQSEVTVFLSHVAYTITVALIASLLIAQTVIPLLALKVRPPVNGNRGQWLKSLTAGYARVLAFSLRHRWTTALLVLAVLLSAAVPMGKVEQDMFDNVESDRLMLRYNVAGSYTLDKVREAVDQIEAYLWANQTDFEFESLYSYYNDSRAETTLILKDDRRLSNEETRNRVRENLPPIAIGSPSFEFRRAANSESLSLRLHGESTEALFGLGEEVVRLLSSIDGLVDVRSGATAGGEEVRVRVDAERAHMAGLSTTEIAQAVSVAMRGQALNEFRGPEGELIMRLEFHGADRQSSSQLANLPLVNRHGERIRLAAVADLETVSGPTNISRQDRRTSLNVEANLREISMNDARDQMSAMMNQVSLPPGYSWSFGQAFQQDQEAMQQMLFNMLLALMLIFIVMAALFESTLFPISIITSILFSFIGVYWFFFITGTNMSIMALIGMLVLMGIVVNNGIVLIDHVNNLRRRGMARDKAVIQAGRDRLRPILMTAATTILAMIPLAIGNTRIGGGGPPYYPMARAIIGGLAFSTVISLIVVPYVYVLLDSLRQWTGEVRRRAVGRMVEADKEARDSATV